MIFDKEINYLQYCKSFSAYLRVSQTSSKLETDICTIRLYFITWRTKLIFSKLESYSTKSSHISIIPSMLLQLVKN